MPDKTDQNMSIDHNEQTDIWLLARPNRPIYGYTNRTDRITGFGQTDHNEIWALTRQNRPKYGFWSVRKDINMGIGQTESPKYG